MADDMSAFDAMAADTRQRHAQVEAKVRGEKPKTGLVVSQVSLQRDLKVRYTRIAKEHGLSLSALFRLATDEYIRTHEWE